MMKQQPSEKGFVSITVLLLLLFVFSIMAVISMSRSIFITNDFHREFVQKQAYYLAKGAIQDAVLQLQTNNTIQQTPKIIPVKVSPIFVGNDPLNDDEPGSSRIYDATCSYSINKMETGMDKNIPSQSTAFIITAKAEISYRQTTLKEIIHTLCYKNDKEEWIKIPLQ